MVEAQTWRQVAAGQAGLITRSQLRTSGVDRWAVAHRIESERWQRLASSRVVATTAGPLSREQLFWLGVLHAGPGALLGGLTAAELAGLKNWHRDAITVLTPSLARQRALTSPDRLVVRCTSRELRDEPAVVARDLVALGAPRAA